MLCGVMWCDVVFIAAEEEAQGHIAALHQQPAALPAATVARPRQAQSQAKAEQLKALADDIPATREALFSYSIAWDVVDSRGLVASVLKPWVVKKFVEYLGG